MGRKDEIKSLRDKLNASKADLTGKDHEITRLRNALYNELSPSRHSPFHGTKRRKDKTSKRAWVNGYGGLALFSLSPEFAAGKDQGELLYCISQALTSHIQSMRMDIAGEPQENITTLQFSNNASVNKALEFTVDTTPGSLASQAAEKPRPNPESPPQEESLMSSTVSTCIEFLSRLLGHLGEQESGKSKAISRIDRSHSLLVLWAKENHVYDGRLDASLQSSTHVRCFVSQLLDNISRSLTADLLPYVLSQPLTDGPQATAELQQLSIKLKQHLGRLDKRREVFPHGDKVHLDEIAEDLETDTRTLLRLGPYIEELSDIPTSDLPIGSLDESQHKQEVKQEPVDAALGGESSPVSNHIISEIQGSFDSFGEAMNGVVRTLKSQSSMDQSSAMLLIDKVLDGHVTKASSQLRWLFRMCLEALINDRGDTFAPVPATEKDNTNSGSGPAGGASELNDPNSEGTPMVEDASSTSSKGNAPNRVPDVQFGPAHPPEPRRSDPLTARTSNMASHVSPSSPQISEPRASFPAPRRNDTGQMIKVSITPAGGSYQGMTAEIKLLPGLEKTYTPSRLALDSGITIFPIPHEFSKHHMTPFGLELPIGHASYRINSVALGITDMSIRSLVFRDNTDTPICLGRYDCEQLLGFFSDVDPPEGAYIESQQNADEE